MGQYMQYIVSFADIIKKGELSRQNRHHKKRSFGEIGDHKKEQTGPSFTGRKRQKSAFFDLF